MEFATAMEAMKHLEAVVDAGQEIAEASVGMLIDMVSTRYGWNPVEFADTIASCVRDVNGNMGAYEDAAPVNPIKIINGGLYRDE